MKFRYFIAEESDLGTTGRVFTAYIFDEETGHHFCELQPRYECHPVITFCEKEVDDDLWAELQTYEVTYPYCRGIDKVARDFTNPERDPDESDEEYLEQVLEWARANCATFEVIP